MNITTASPAEIDTEIHRLARRARSAIGRGLISLRRDLSEAENQALGLRREPPRPPRRRTARRDRGELGQRGTPVNGDQLEPLHQQWIARGGWTRWYLVPDGHLHYDISGDRCSRIPTTDHYWMTEHSGRSAEEMVELAGDRVCTTCFKDAPVTPRPATARFMTPSEAERAAYREAATRKRAAVKAAQMTSPDGRELRTAGGVHGDLIKTEVAARRRALQDATDLAFYGTGHPSFDEWRETVTRMVFALAHRQGRSPNYVFEEIRKKVNAKARREHWQPKSGWSIALSHAFA
jgi:hypothetical protein